MKLQQLKTFLAIVDLRSFSEAAASLGVAQASVSYAVAELEKELGIKLLIRNHAGATPTDVGASIAIHARQMLSLEAVIEQESQLTLGELKGQLRIASFRSAAAHIMPPVVARLRAEHPALSLTITEVENLLGSIKTILNEARTDVAFMQLVDAHDFIFWELMRDPYIVLIPEASFQDRKQLGLKDLENEALILYDANDKCGFPIRQLLRDRAPNLKPTYEVKQDSTILSMVAQGLGMSIMPTLAVDNVPRGVRMLNLAEGLERVIGVAVPPGNLKMPAVRAFLNCLKAEFPESKVPTLNLNAFPSSEAEEDDNLHLATVSTKAR